MVAANGHFKKIVTVSRHLLVVEILGMKKMGGDGSGEGDAVLDGVSWWVVRVMGDKTYTSS